MSRKQPGPLIIIGGHEDKTGERLILKEVAAITTARAGNLAMGAGLGLIRGVTIDSHFAQRGRIGRLLAAVIQNPINLGLGIDEDTAILVRQE